MLDSANNKVNVTTDDASKSPSQMSHSYEEADNGAGKDTDRFFEERNDMLAKNKVAGGPGDQSPGSYQKGMVTLKPMSQLTASSTVVNLLLATGPFS